MKKILRIFLLVFTVFTFAGINVKASDGFFELGNAGYKVIEKLEENDLNFGVTHYKEKSQSKVGSSTFNQEVNILEVPVNSEAKIVSFANLAGHKWTLTTVSNLAAQFEQENPGWRVLGAVNGDFFDISGNGNLPFQTSNPMITLGDFYRTSGNNMVAFPNDGTINSLLGGKPTKTSAMILSVFDEDDNVIEEFSIEKLNVEPGNGESAVFFGVYGSDKKYVPKAFNVSGDKFVVENSEIALPNNTNDFYGRGVISSLEYKEPLKVGQFAIVTKNNDLKTKLSLGNKIRVQYKYTGEFANISSATGHNGKFLSNGEYIPHTNNLNERHPRTVVGKKADGTLVFAVIDGRAAATGKEGMHGADMAAFMKSSGCVDAYNLDGGGSSVLVIRENGKFVVKNSPSDGRERSDGNALLIAVQVPVLDIKIEQDTTYLDFNINILKSNQFDIQSLYVKIGDRTIEVKDNYAKFLNLSSNSEYYYEILYKNSSGKIQELMIDGITKTLKTDPILNHLIVKEDQITYILELSFDDPQNSSNLKNAKIFINDRQYLFRDNQLALLKSSVPVIYSIKLEFEYDNNSGKVLIEIINLDYRLVNSTVTEKLRESFKSYNDRLLKIYK